MLAYSVQSQIPDEIIIAEDGQDLAIKKIVKKWQKLLNIDLKHITQRDLGFRKNRVLNKAIKLSTSKQLIFTDQDIFPRKYFIKRHKSLLSPGTFIAGGSHLNIDSNFHKFLNKRQQLNFSRWRLVSNQYLSFILDFVTPRNTFIGCNSSVYKVDLVKVGEFDESLVYEGEDRNLGIRLNNLGIKGRCYKYSLVCLHLDHQRSYVDKEKVIKNKAYNKKIKKNRSINPKKVFL
jgi:cellulose synthase/poly-beta-1,6-N-acetylglucosamine synthase-like glycosyltransferase